ncbi:MAG: phosphate ABC transporter permease PstA [Paracoccus sp. (in: a-proteobacteria)]|uniref:phosphate ABC transporter permease PstA n=1 Tax=Paracoccus sp. TaxID=267 RepID=UPI0026DF26D5|nr:phosphate ABC transporter permease PstA [Paracoccus sp. (in: a-proteobacteria)]MDO5620942.1 phosphate ABC transporter permease PstA [Paracoccus sp. (in: a-proteobacteria)]
MTEVSQAMPGGAPRKSLLVKDARTKKRNAAEARFRGYGIAAIGAALLVLVFLIGTIIVRGLPAFTQSYLTVPVTVEASVADPQGNRNPDDLRKVYTMAYAPMLTTALEQYLQRENIQIEGLTERDIADFYGRQARSILRNHVLSNPEEIGSTIEVPMLVNSRIDGMLKGRIDRDTAARDAKTSVAQYDLAMALKDHGVLGKKFNWNFLTGPDADDSQAESAGLGIALIGSAYMMLIVLVLSLPVGVAASIYLEEFAPKNKWTDAIEVNISNLAAVPSIVFGILGLAAFINFFGMPRSTPLVGGLVLALMTLPTIIISTRAALKAVPPSIRDAALGIGASRMQTVFHHVLPLAMPGILTGTIIGLAQALGETAPLLLIGMVAFVVNYPGPPPGGITDAAPALPVQVYNWIQRSDAAFRDEKAWGAIIVLLVFMLSMNVLAIILRRRFERRW